MRAIIWAVSIVACALVVTNDGRADTIYGGHTYKVVIDDIASWSDAALSAESMGGYLATITSQEEQDALLAYFYDQDFATGGYWIGLQEASTEGVWEWYTGETFDYTHWWDGEPNNWANVENKGQMHWAHSTIYSDRRGYWNDAPDAGYAPPDGVPLDVYRAGYIVEVNSVVPEPSSLVALASLSLTGIAIAAWKRRKKRRPAEDH